MSDLAPTEETKRLLARRVLIRAADFVDHAKSMKGDLLTEGGDYEDLKSRWTAYAAELDDHYGKARDRLSAHQQDLELAERIELWEDVEAEKVGYFVDGAQEIYDDCLGPMGLEGFVPYSSLPELADPTLPGALNLALDDAPEAGVKVVMSSDLLAITRPGTVGILNGTIIHQRAGQLALLRRWIRLGANLWKAIRSLDACRRIATAQLLTDVVSFADCLVSRSDGSPRHQMDGLDKLVDAGDRGPFDRFQESFRFAEIVGFFRESRNKVGAHLETDPRVSLDDLHECLDSVDMWKLVSFYQTLGALFRDVCGRILFLNPYLVDDEPLMGATDTTTRMRIAGYHRD